MKRLVLLTAIVALGLSLPVAAQLEPVQMDPEDGATIGQPARSLRVWFDAAPDVDASELTLEGPRGPMSVQGLHTMGDDDLMARVVGSMPNGEYTASWKTAGVDGQESSGTWSFTVKRGSSESAAAASATASEGEAAKSEDDGVVDVGILLYEGFEPLDVFGPVEMLMNVGAQRLRVHMIAEEKGLVASSAGAYPSSIAPKVEATFSFDDAPHLDVLMVPGGFGTVQAVTNQKLLDWIAERAPQAKYTTSVCSGSAILAKAGLLEGVKATGTKQLFSYVASFGPKTEWIEEARWVEDGAIITSSGVSAGIDMTLALIAKLFGDDAATSIANATEYEWHRDASTDPFVEYLNAAMPSGGGGN